MREVCQSQLERLRNATDRLAEAARHMRPGRPEMAGADWAPLSLARSQAGRPDGQLIDRCEQSD